MATGCNTTGSAAGSAPSIASEREVEQALLRFPFAAVATDMKVPDIARLLGERTDQLVGDLLPGGHREGHEWRCGSITGEAGDSLGVHLTGAKAGIWADFSTGQKGDALDLVRAVFGLDMRGALAWSRRWLGLENGEVAVPRRPAPPAKPEAEQQLDPDRWRRVWGAAKPIAGTPATIYLANRRLRFADRDGLVLRFAPRRARKSPEGDLEYHPALLAGLRDFRTGEQVGIINVYLSADGRNRLRDSKAKTVSGRAKAAAVMFGGDFADVTMGLALAEGVETAIALLSADLAPVWACGGSGNLAGFPVLGGVEALTICADADPPGQAAAAAVAARWRDAGREVVVIAPPSGDWADPKHAGST